MGLLLLVHTRSAVTDGGRRTALMGSSRQVALGKSHNRSRCRRTGRPGAGAVASSTNSDYSSARNARGRSDPCRRADVLALSIGAPYTLPNMYDER